jgi:hypothetical protein
MPKLPPPPGTVTRQTAVKVLLREHVITSPAMLAKLKGISRVVLQGRTHGFYREDQLLEIINAHRLARHQPPITNLLDEEHDIVFRQATPEDMAGVYEVAHKLFGHTTSAEDRIPLVQRCPEGNYVVTDHGKIVSYAHIQPLLSGPLKDFLSGKFRGSAITAEYLDPFQSGKVVDVLIKSLGSYHEQKATSTRYSQALFMGLRHELIKWGYKGYIIHRVYATSETPSGIEKAVDFKMKSLGKIRGSRGKKRFAFELDPLASDYRIIEEYRMALEQWKHDHPAEYEIAWRKWREQHPADN